MIRNCDSEPDLEVSKLQFNALSMEVMSKDWPQSLWGWMHGPNPGIRADAQCPLHTMAACAVVSQCQTELVCMCSSGSWLLIDIRSHEI